MRPPNRGPHSCSGSCAATGSLARLRRLSAPNFLTGEEVLRQWSVVVEIREDDGQVLGVGQDEPRDDRGPERSRPCCTAGVTCDLTARYYVLVRWPAALHPLLYTMSN